MRLCEKKEGTAGQHRPSPLGCAPGALGERGSRRSGVASKTAPLAGGRGATDSHGALRQAFSRRCKGSIGAARGSPGAASSLALPPGVAGHPALKESRRYCKKLLAAVSFCPLRRRGSVRGGSRRTTRQSGRVAGRAGGRRNRRQGPGCALLPPVRGLPVLPRSGAFSPGRASPFCESCAVKIVKNPFVHKFFSIGLLHFRKNALK